jgi:hypothetical protein
VFVVILAASAAASCSTKDSAPVVATVAFTASQTKVPLGSPDDFTYRFDIAPGAPAIPGDYRVFVHMNNPDGQTLWSDDHLPEVPTSQWKPGQTIQYTRTAFIPVVPYVGSVNVVVGVYKDDTRLSLQGQDSKDRDSNAREYKVGTLELEPRSEGLAVVYRTGWHAMEYAPDNVSNSWQWTEKAATVGIANPHADATLYLQYDARPDLFGGQPQQVTVSANNQPVATFPADSNEQVLKRIPVTAAQLGTGDTADVRIEVDRTFTPAKLPGGGNDQRELGLRVYHIALERR